MRHSLLTACFLASTLMVGTALPEERVKTEAEVKAKKDKKRSAERIGGGAVGGAVLGGLMGGGKGAAVGAAAGGGGGYVYDKHKKQEKEKQQR